MGSQTPNTKLNNIFLQMHPLHRILISVGVSILSWFFLRNHHHNILIHIIEQWDVFAATMLLTSWIVIFTRSPQQIRALASKEDGSLLFVYLLILLASFASMITVLLLMVSSDALGVPKWLYLVIVISGILLSWAMVHTTFTYHYARVYYSNDGDNPTTHSAGLSFPDEDCPDYVDFAYYSFVIGMTFQVSDVETRSRKLRRITLMHSMLSFVLNTFIVALTINLIASLKT